MNRLVCQCVVGAMAALLAGCSSTSFDTQSSGTKNTPQALANINTQLGIAYLEKGRLGYALTQLKAALKEDPGLSRAHDAIAVVYERLGRTQLAIEHYRQAIRLDPGNASAQNNYGDLLCRDGQYALAERHFLAAAQDPLNRHAAMAYTNAARCVPKTAPPGTVVHYLRAALVVDPSWPAALLDMAMLRHKEGRNSEALAYLRRYEKSASISPEMLLLGVQVARALGDEVDEMHYASLLIARYPRSPQMRLLRLLQHQTTAA